MCGRVEAIVDVDDAAVPILVGTGSMIGLRIWSGKIRIWLVKMPQPGQLADQPSSDMK